MKERILCLVCAACIALAGCSPAQSTSMPQVETKTEAAIERKSLNEYTWDELSRISAQLTESEKTDGYDAARALAASYGLIDEDGSLTRQTKQIVLNDTRALDVRLAGILHDDRSDGQGRAGLAFMTVGALDIRPMNDEDTVEGGWEGSALRSWLNGEAREMLDDDLAAAIVPVDKPTNNTGITEDFDSVSVTSDGLWLFSPREVCGDVNWDVDEYQGKRGDYNIDGLLNSEGNQYEAFAVEGVTQSSDPNGFLSLEPYTGASPWWYRTPYPFDWVGVGDTGTNGYFYQVTASGYPESLGSPQVPAAVVAGFCV